MTTLTALRPSLDHPRPTRQVMLLCLGAALACLVIAPSAGASLRVGLHTAGEQSYGESQRMAQGRVGVMRTQFSPTAVSADPSAPSGRYDATVGRAAATGIPVLPYLIASYGGASPVKPPSTVAEVDSYKRALTALARRYGPNGTFWCRTPGHIPVCSNSYRPITTWQVWNEPNLNHFWNGNPSARQYAALLRVSRAALRAGDPGAKIVLAGMPPYTGAGIDMKRYLTKFYGVQGVKKQFEAIALHPYAADETGVEGGLYRLRNWLEANRDPDRRVWLTEIGWGTDGTASNRANGFVKTYSGQAKVLRRTFGMLKEKRRRYNLGTAVWFLWRDYGPPPGASNQFYYHAGLFKKSGEPKPSWTAFTGVTGGSPGSGALSSSSTQQVSASAATIDPSAPADEVSPTPAK